MRIQEINRKHMTHVHHHTPNDINELNDELLSLAFDLAEMDQEAAAILMLVNKRFSTAAKLMSCWSQLDWSKLAQCAGKPNGQEKFASLMRTIKCWLGRKVILFNGRSCGVSSQLLTDDVIETVIRSAPNLEVCTLRGCPRITDIGLKRIAKATPKLNTFIMQWSGRNVYYPGIIEIVRGNSNLTTFAISCDMESKSLAKPEAGNELAEALVESCKHIRHLELSDTSIGDSGLSALANGYHNTLETLTLNYCKRFTAWGIQAIASRCKNLTSFSANSSGITNQGLLMLAMGCPRLEALWLDRCKAIELNGIVRALEANASIEFISLTGVWGSASNEEQRMCLDWVKGREGAVNIEIHKGRQVNLIRQLGGNDEVKRRRVMPLNAWEE